MYIKEGFMKRLNKISNIALIFLVIGIFLEVALCYALRVPIGSLETKEHYSNSITQSRKAIRHDFGNFYALFNNMFLSNQKKSQDFEDARKLLLKKINTIAFLLEKESVVSWQEPFEKLMTAFKESFIKNDKIINILCKELDKNKGENLKNSIRGIWLSYKGFCLSDEVKAINLRELFGIINSLEIMGYRYCTLIFEQEEGIGNIFYKEGAIFRTLLNLVRNARESIFNKRDDACSSAIEFSNYKGDINIKVTKKEKLCVIEIADTGVGMSQEAIEAFYRDGVFTTKDAGGGRGLRTAKTLIEKNGGTIDIQSELGKGTTFTIKLPLASGKTALPTNSPQNTPFNL